MKKQKPNSNLSSAEEIARKQRKKDKLVQALKANMQRRKAQVRARDTFPSLLPSGEGGSEQSEMTDEGHSRV